MARFTGFHELPELTDRDWKAIEAKEYHKLKKSQHVASMDQMIVDSLSLPPEELEGAVLQFDRPQQASHPYAYVVITKDAGGEQQFQIVQFMDTMIDRQQISELAEADRQDLLRMKSEHRPERSVL